MGKVLVIGAGSVANVTVKKCATLPDVFEEIHLASRTKEKCDRIAAEAGVPIRTYQVDADDVAQTAALIEEVGPDLVVHLALPYQDLSIMEACLQAGVDYLDTANYESPDDPRFHYGPQWALHERFREKGLMALLGCGFDPGVTSAYAMHLRREHFDRIDALDIVDCNGGKHGHAFATNFNPEINIREITQRGKYWENGEWVEVDPLSVAESFDFPGVGVRKAYLMYHEELESLVRFLPELKRARFWMTFGEEYLTHLRVLQNVGMTRIDPVEFEGRQIVPLQFLKAVLPDPSSLGEDYSGVTCIGVLAQGVKDGERKRMFIWNNCDHQQAYRETGGQAIAYTTGVPAMCGAALMLRGTWRGDGVFNIEQMDPGPFLAMLTEHGLPWQERDVLGEVLT